MQEPSQVSEPTVEAAPASIVPTPSPVSPLGESQVDGPAYTNSDAPKVDIASTPADDRAAFLKLERETRQRQLGHFQEILGQIKCLKELMAIGYFPGNLARKLPAAAFYVDNLLRETKRVIDQMQQDLRKSGGDK